MTKVWLVGVQAERPPVPDRYPLGRLQWSVVAGHTGVGVLAAWLAVGVGGSLSTAPKAIAVMWATLLISGGVAGVVLGLRRGHFWVWADAAIVLAAFYGGTWAFSDSHSAVGDVAVAVVAGLPIALAASASVWSTPRAVSLTSALWSGRD